MKYNGIDYNDYLIEQALENMGDAEFAAMVVRALGFGQQPAAADQG